MNRSRTTALTAVLMLGITAGCVSTPLSAPSDGQVVMGASPATIQLDEFATPPVTVGTALVTAQFFGPNGVPQPGLSVVFSSDAGSLTSAPPGQPATPLETDDDGIVGDILTVQVGDPAEIEVSVRSGTLVQSVTVAKQEAVGNQPPQADLDINPAGAAGVNDSISIDGSESVDPDGDLITCYQFQIEPGANIPPPPIPCPMPNSRCEIIQGPNAGSAAFSRSYDTEQVITVILRVTDDPNVPCPSNGPATPFADFNGIDTEVYEILCDPTPPVANAGNNQTVTLGGQASVNVPLSGLLSTDPDSQISNYVWNCGNGLPALFGASVICTYDTAGNYSASLTVTNGCGQTDTDNVSVFVNP